MADQPNRQNGISRRQVMRAAAVMGAGVAAAQVAAPGVADAADYVDQSTPGAPAAGNPVDAYGAQLAKQPLKPITIKRRDVGAKDVQVEVLYTGLCHSDIHQVDNDWSNSVYPCVPGHEIVGRVSAVGAQVADFKIGDHVAIGTLVDSCQQCRACREGLEQYCEGPKGATNTYNGPFKPDGTNTYGGYSVRIVVKDHFVFKVPANLDLKAVPPLLCAGLTTYSPLKHWEIKPGQKVGVVGMGGLGHMAVKLAAAMGADVTVFSTTPEKEADAKKFGAKNFVLSKDADALQKLELTHDFMLVTIPEPFDVNPYIKIVKRDGALATVGLLTPYAAPIDNSQVAFHRRTVSGSLVGGVPETKELLEFCGRHNIASTVEVISMSEINNAFLNVRSGKVRYRYVIDVANTLKPA